MKFLIVGRTGSGKDELKRYLQSKYGWSFVKSYTTRPKRTPDEDTHIFITHEEAKAIPDSEKVAVTFITNNTDTPDEYFATTQQVQECDAYIIDPIGVQMLLKNMPDETFEIIYIEAESEEKRKEMACDRHENKEDAIRIFEKRCTSEQKQFDDFEESLQNGTFGTDNCTVAVPVINHYTEESMDEIALKLHTFKQIYHKLTGAVEDLMNSKLINVSESGKPIIYRKNMEHPDQPIQEEISKEQFAQQMYHDHEGFYTCMASWLGIPTTSLENQAHVKTQADITLRDYIQDLLEPKYKNPEQRQEKVNTIVEKLINHDEFWEQLDNLVDSLL